MQTTTLMVVLAGVLSTLMFSRLVKSSLETYNSNDKLGSFSNYGAPGPQGYGGIAEEF